LLSDLSSRIPNPYALEIDQHIIGSELADGPRVS
jgi:hypothetical protein